jgi:DnaK suppressor protein
MALKNQQRFQRRLLEMRGRLAGDINPLIETVLADAKAVGEHDASVSETSAKELALEHTEESIRQQVINALARIDAGTYGVCESCGGQVEPGRLEALPYAPYCIKCEKARERQPLLATTR